MSTVPASSPELDPTDGLPLDEDAALAVVRDQPLTAEQRKAIRDRARATGDEALRKIADALET